MSLHTPLTEEAKNMIGAKKLALMKKSAYLVNIARAVIIDRESLYTVLSNSKIAGAAFDVFWEESPDPNDKLLKLNNFVLIPHIAGWSTDSVDAIARIIATNIERYAQGEIPVTIINHD
jgi:D-3-phosphoglycerate dehydrogenase